MTLLETVSQPAHPATPRPADERQVVLRARGLRKAFGGQVVLNGINLDLRQGEVVLLRGENGSGKTTLLNILTGNLEPDTGEIHYSADDTPRSYHFPRRWWQNLNPWDHFRPEFVAMEGMGRTWQEVRLFRSLSLRDNLTVAEPGHSGENPLVALLAPSTASSLEAELNIRADAMLARLGLGGRESSSADMVSLGQSKRVAIARAVAAGARILFLDEPFAGLDSQGIRDVFDLLESLVRKQDLTLVIIEHVFNQPHLHGLVTTDWLLENGKLHRNRAHPSKSTNKNRKSTRPSWFSLLAGDDAEILDEPLPRGAVLTRIRRPDRWSPEAKPILEIKSLVVKRGARTVIGLDENGDPTGFNLTLHEGEIAILQAPNGWGKSTLFDAICGFLNPFTGVILSKSIEVSSLQPWQRFNDVLGALPAHGSFSSLAAWEAFKLAKSENTCLLPKNLIRRTASSLSGGEKRKLQMLCLAPALVNILDEPFSALDQIALTQFAMRLRMLDCLLFEPRSDPMNSFL